MLYLFLNKKVDKFRNSDSEVPCIINFLIPEILNKNLQKFTEKFVFLYLNTNFKCSIGLLKWAIIKTNEFKTFSIISNI